MKVFAGPRGSGKTYSLAHAVMNDEHGVLVVRDYDLIEWAESEYPELRGRVFHRNRLKHLPLYTVLYIDEVRNGDDLSWASPRGIGAIAVAFRPQDSIHPSLSGSSYAKNVKDQYFPDEA